MASDASRFSLTFADVISASAPHIYISALPFAPPSSLVSKRYCGQFPRTIKVLHEDGIKWPAMRFSISTSAYVYCVSVHPDGKRVAAGMSSSTVMVISVATGDTLFDLSGHGGTVRAIAHGPNGKRIATGANLKCRFPDCAKDRPRM
jgi:WD40 repeat protein